MPPSKSADEITFSIQTMKNIEAPEDLSLGIEGFEFSDLFNLSRLKDLADIFDGELAAARIVIGSASVFPKRWITSIWFMCCVPRPIFRNR